MKINRASLSLANYFALLLWLTIVGTFYYLITLGLYIPHVDYNLSANPWLNNDTVTFDVYFERHKCERFELDIAIYKLKNVPNCPTVWESSRNSSFSSETYTIADNINKKLELGDIVVASLSPNETDLAIISINNRGSGAGYVSTDFYIIDAESGIIEYKANKRSLLRSLNVTDFLTVGKIETITSVTLILNLLFSGYRLISMYKTDNIRRKAIVISIISFMSCSLGLFACNLMYYLFSWYP